MNLRQVYRNIQVGSGGSWGARVAVDEEPQPVASVLPAATHQNLGWAAGFWPQADESEFEWGLGDMKVRHRETGTVYTIRVGMPVGGEIASGVSTWCVRGDRLILLQDKPDRPLALVVHGTFGGRKIEPRTGPPRDGMAIR
jgi:hypothetical protein